MKKWIQGLVALAAAVTLAACGSTAAPEKTAESTSISTSEAVILKATVILKEDGKEIANQAIEVKPETSVYDALAENFEVKDDNGFITSIDGKEQNADANKYWMYKINDTMAEKGAKEIIVNDGDKIEFELAEVSY